MSFTNTKAIMDSVQTMIQDNSPALRAKMLTWLNNILKRLAPEFPWRCLVKSSVIGVAGNVLALPADYQEMDSLKIAGMYFTVDDEMTLSNAFLWAAGGAIPIGYLITGQTLTLVPGVPDGNAELVYLQEVPSYTDSAASILFPSKFQPLLERTLLSTYYEFDADPRANVFTVPFDSELITNLKVTEVRNPDVARKYARWLKAAAMTGK